jgi:phosphatidylserine/phosphatidylglycerophosphate/cardiolipin synthase-like enzyme
MDVGEGTQREFAVGGARTPLLRPGENCWRIEDAYRFAVLVDGDAYFGAVRSAMARARRRIILLGWDFDSRTKLRPQRRRKSRQVQLGNFLRELVEARPELEIYILIWWGSIFYGANQDLPVTFGDTWWSHPRIQFRLDDHHPLGAAHHQKVVCIDDKVAFVGGMDLTQCRWDSCSHPPDHKHRCDGANNDAPYGPVHDVQTLFDGPAARALAELAYERWRVLTGDTLNPIAPERTDPWPARVRPLIRSHPIAVARTLPPVGEQPEAREIEALNIAMLEAAQRYIYIEAQYYTIPGVNDLLAALLRRRDGPEIVFVANDVPSGWIEQQAMFENRDRLFANLRLSDPYSRLRTYTPVSRLSPPCLVKVHSKLIVVDDKILRIGSANLASRSLGIDTECDIAVHAQSDQSQNAITQFLSVLVGEHVDVGPRRVARMLNRTGSLIRTIEHFNRHERRLMAFPVVPVTAEQALAPVTPIVDPHRPIDLKYIWNWIWSGAR